MDAFPRFLRVRQEFSRCEPIEVRAAVAAAFARLRPRVPAGARIAVAVGSRGITGLAEIVTRLLELLRAVGARPFVLPAMGSHGGATPEGQRGVLAGYGITEASTQAEIRASLEVRQIGLTAGKGPVYCSREALAADGILLINRIKPHTDFSGALGSGLLKMCVVGLGKQTGAAALHLAASEHGHEHAIRSMAAVVLQEAPVLGGLAILESPSQSTAQITALTREEMPAGEARLLAQARALLPRLPFDEVDLLIVDRLGKNISGTGMDTNVINRAVDGYSTSLRRGDRPAPFFRRIFVRDLSPETHGNAIGIGLADVTTTRLVRATDPRVTGINALTALTPNTAKLPLAFDSDREAIEQTLGALGRLGPDRARVIRIRDTLTLGEFSVSGPLWAEWRAGHPPGASGTARLTPLGPPRPLEFDGSGNLSA